MSKSLKQQSIMGVLWTLVNRSSIQVVQFAVSLVLARLLSPEDYGVVGLAYIVIALTDCFTNLGLGGAIVQKKEVDELDYNTFFWADCSVRLAAFGVLSFIAPVFARYYDHLELCNIVRLIALTIPLGCLTSVSGLKLTRAMDFKTTAWIGVVTCVFSGALGICAALKGWGGYALVVQNISGTILGIPLMLWMVPWRPRKLFSYQRFKEFFNFGYKLLFSGILDTFYNNITGLIVGKAYSVQDLGYLSKGEHLPQMAMNAINGPINSVSFPMLSKLQDDKDKYRLALRKALKTSLFFVAPLLTGMIVVARPMILLLFGEKWLPAVPFLQIMAISYIFYPVHTLNLNALVALGRTDLFLKLEIYKKGFGILIMMAFIPLGLMVFVCSRLLSAAFSIYINTMPLKKLIQYSTWQQITDISKALLGSAIMFLILYPMNFLPWNPYLIMGIQIPLGGAIYLAHSWVFARDMLAEMVAVVINVVHRKNVA